MKQYILRKPEQRPEAKPRKLLKAKAPGKAPTQLAEIIKIGVDVGLNKYAYSRQVDGSGQEPPHLCSPEEFREYAVAQKGWAKRVVVCYEAGLFGFELARWLQDNEVECLVMSPVKLDEGNKRVETDKLNARDIGSRLDRYLAGNTRALQVCRIPSRAEELARHQTRQRQQLLDHRKALEAQGRSLLWEFGYLEEGKHCWWREGSWELLVESLEQTIQSRLARLRSVILQINKEIKAVEEELSKQAGEGMPEGLKKLPTGMGWLSVWVVLREFMDPKRFRNRRQVGCFTGLVPSEASTGESFRQGSVTKVGNPVVRAILVEMAWRLVRYQPNCRAIKPRLRVLKDRKAGPRARKKAIVAAARVLAVDLWRLATGQTTVENLGFAV